MNRRKSAAGSMDTIKVEIWRGRLIESIHECAFVIAGADGSILKAGGDFEKPIYPRSAIKAFQALPMIETGAADRFGFSESEIALACSSHGGEPDHISAAQSMLDKIGCSIDDLECGSHWPMRNGATRDLAARHQSATAIHNNCSGKHAGMLALAKQLDADSSGYVDIDHTVQRRIAETLHEVTGVEVDRSPVATDGCSVPTWAMPLDKLAIAFARFGGGTDLPDKRRIAADRIIRAVRNHPFYVAGNHRFCSRMMTAVPRSFVKTGAEGVFCGCIPDKGIGIALKCMDGATRAAEAAMAACLLDCDVWDKSEADKIAKFATVEYWNWRRITTGELRAVMPGVRTP